MPALPIAWIDPQSFAVALARAGILIGAGRPPLEHTGGSPMKGSRRSGLPVPALPGQLMGAGTVEDGAGATAAAPVRPSPGGFKQELDDLRRWLSAEVPGYRGAFLVEETGLEVFNDQPRPDLLSFASALYHDVVDLAEVVEEPRPESITLSRGDGSLVHLVAVESRIGRLILGVQVEGQHGLGDPRVIAATLRRVTDSMLRE